MAHEGTSENFTQGSCGLHESHSTPWDHLVPLPLRHIIYDMTTGPRAVLRQYATWTTSETRSGTGLGQTSTARQSKNTQDNAVSVGDSAYINLFLYSLNVLII